jgi:hypothetical protein
VGFLYGHGVFCVAIKEDKKLCSMHLQQQYSVI